MMSRFCIVLMLAIAGGLFAQDRPAAQMPLVERLLRMRPAERERVLRSVPPGRRAQIRQRLQRFDSLPIPERRRRLRQLELLWSQPPERREVIREQMRSFSAIPQPRRAMLRLEMALLARLSEAERAERIEREAFKTGYSPDEQRLIQDLWRFYSPPPRPRQAPPND